MKLRSTAIATIVTVALASVTFLVGSSGAQAAPNKDKPKTLIAYSENASLTLVDGNKVGADDGDLFHRHASVSLKLGGPIIGVSYTQAEIISSNKISAVDVRRIFVETLLPKGRVFYMGVVETALGTVILPGWKTQYAIIGGTGDYANAQGTMTVTLLPDGKTFKSVSTYTLG